LITAPTTLFNPTSPGPPSFTPEQSSVPNDQSRIDAFIDQAIRMIRSREFDRVTALATQLEDTAAIQAIKYLKDQNTAFDHAAKELVGRDVHLETLKGPIAGKVLEYQDRCWQIERRFSVNGAGATMKES